MPHAPNHHSTLARPRGSLLAARGLVGWMLMAGVLMGWACSSAAQGDIFYLETGGQITGALLDRGSQGEYVIQNEQGAVVTLSPSQVEKVEAQDPIDQQYLRRSRALPNTAEAHRALAAWCHDQHLGSQARHHLERLLELEPDDEPARSRLGYQKLHGRWMTRDQIMAARGLQKYDGDYRTPQDIALRKRTQQHDETETEWFRQIRTWVGWLDKRQAEEAAQAIAAIDDPLAAPGIVKLLEREKDPYARQLLTATLAQLKHPLATTTLVDFSLHDPDPEVRLQCLDWLLEYHQPLSLSPYLQALDPKKHDNRVINRAARALRMLENPAALSPLIDALVTSHLFKNPQAPVGNTGASFSPQGGGGGLSMGGDKKKLLRRDLENLEVRQALVELSGGQDYGFDQKLWRRWYINQQIPDTIDTRRDP